VDREDRGGTGCRTDDVLRVAVGGTAVEAEGYGRGCCGGHLYRCAIPIMAYDAAPGCLVPQCWMYGPFGTFLRYGYLPVDPVLRHRFRCPAWLVVVP
jgi:hypothetical protein